MTTIALHPSIALTLREVEKRLLKLQDEGVDDTAWSMRLNIRGGIPRHWKFTLEDEPNLPELNRQSRVNAIE